MHIQNTEEWESEITRADSLKFLWSQSPYRKRALLLIRNLLKLRDEILPSSVPSSEPTTSDSDNNDDEPQNNQQKTEEVAVY